MKDFQADFIEKQQKQQYYDPFIYTTKQVREEIVSIQQQKAVRIACFNSVGLLLVSPLQTIVTSLQLSVKPHKNLYERQQTKTKSLAKLNTSLTIQQKRKLELMIRSGGQQTPHTAPVYQGYMGAIRGLLSQGYASFFKGTFFRLIHQQFHLLSIMNLRIFDQNHIVNEKPSFLISLGKFYLFQTFLDMVLNILHISQNRYILQNNIPEFKVFRNSSQAIGKMLVRNQNFNGMMFHAYNNFVQIFFRLPFLLAIQGGVPHLQVYVMLLINQVLTYPANTAFKRITCQSKNIVGMIPIRYKSVFHAMRVIFSEQGLMGLYRGFILNYVSQSIRITTLSLLTPYLWKHLQEQ